jgi:MFS family permease
VPVLGRPGAGVDLGPGYHKLWTAAASSTLGDGMFLAALPLLAATLSRDPLQVSLVSFAGWLPWLLFGLVSGALVDRWDRRQVMWTVEAVRAVLVGVLALAVLAGWASIALLAAIGFLLGTGQTLVDNAAQPFIPALVGRDRQRLERANSQLYGARTVGQHFVGPPAGGVLFSVAAWVPFLVDAVSFAVSSALVATVRGHFRPQDAGDAPRAGLRAEIAQGLRWLFAHRLLRALAVLVGLMNLASMAGQAILVLFAHEQLGLGSAGYGLLLAAHGLGGVLGSLVATRLGRHAGTATLLLAAVLVRAVAWLVFGTVADAWIAGAMLGISGITGAVFGVVGVSLRQAIVPDPLMGRVVSAFRMLGYGAVPVGAILGGVAARTLGLRAPFLLGAAVLAAAALMALPAVNHRAVAAARVAAERPTLPSE